ncbi:MAG: putative Thymus-specific serine protease [Streblomastix strix]|uniref:Putative Thymus-specific serine protease n=1 Tax=Streblomastix strix TaxID=222440 RepID=A0A5J4W6R7_9EUKA|nr:MAG: putative Thymus-specific serine protease [Streblomastix strix]
MCWIKAVTSDFFVLSFLYLSFYHKMLHILFAMVIVSSHAIMRFGPRQIGNNILKELSPTENNFEIFPQKVDHFNPSSLETFKQRYILNGTMYDDSHTLVLYIEGEAQLTLSRAQKGYHAEVAKRLKAYVVALEHRYYGKSLPFFDLTRDNLTYLTSRQALADIANFLDFIVTNKLSQQKIRRILVFGGSYAGSLSAWFRTLYPHLTIGSVASSAPVYAKEDFYEYDQTISKGLGTNCSSLVQEALQEIEDEIDAGQYDSLQSQIQCEGKISNSDDFLYILADMVSHAVQYNQDDGPEDRQTIKQLCTTLQGRQINDDPKQLKDRLFQFTNDQFQKMNTTCFEFSYSREKLQNEKIDTIIDPESGEVVVSDVGAEQNHRQWMYQSCNEFGYFQIAPTEGPSVRSKRLTVQYHRELCGSIFGDRSTNDPTVFIPNVNETNEFYGGKSELAGTNIVFTNGDIDPWKNLGITPNLFERKMISINSILDPSILTRQHWDVNIVVNGSHCTDIHASDDDHDSESVKDARFKTDIAISKWIRGSPTGELVSGKKSDTDPLGGLSDYSPRLNLNSPVFITSMILYAVSVICIFVAIGLFIASRSKKYNVTW